MCDIMSRRWRLDFWSGVLVVALAVVAVLMVWPLYSIFTASVIDNRTGALTLANFAQILGRAAYQGGARSTASSSAPAECWARRCSASRSPC